VSITLEPEAGLDEVYGALAVRRREPGADHMRRAVAAFSRVAAATVDAPSLDDVLHVVAREICLLVGVGRCSIHLPDETGGLFRGRVGHSRGEYFDEAVKRLLAGIPADGITRELLETRRPVIVANARDDPRTIKSTVRLWNIRSLMAVPMILAGEVIGVIFLDEEDRLQLFTEADAELAAAFADLAALPVVQVREQMELRSRLDATHGKVKALHRATAVDERLTEIVVEGRSLQDLLDTLATLLGKPCAVFGASGERLATAFPAGARADGIAPRLLEPEFAQRPAIRDTLLAHEGSPAFVVGPLPAAGVLHRHVVAPVRLGGECWGRLVAMEHKTRFVGGDIVTLRRAAMLIALHVSTERKALEADWDAGSSLAAELLTRCSDPEGVQRRADRLGVRLDAPRGVMLIAARAGSDEHVPHFRTVAAAFQQAAPELTVHVTATSGAVAVLVDVPSGADDGEFAADSRSTLEDVLRLLDPGGRLVAGISTVQAGADGYLAAYQEARQVVDCIRRLSGDEGPAIVSADELGAGRVFLATSDETVVKSFAEQTLGELVADPSKSDLLATLRCFFENAGSIRRSADCLGVHENTIRYRLTRVEEVTGLAVTHDPDSQVRARLSLLSLLLQGRLPESG
jgi:sugar diacid utilization regulator